MGSLKEFWMVQLPWWGLTWGETWRVSPKYQVLRRERIGVEHPEGISSLRGSTVPSGEPSSQGPSQDLALRLWLNEREITALRARRTHWERTLREDWPVVGWQLEACWGGGNSLWAMRASSRIGGPGKAAQTPEEGNGSWERERERERMGGGRESKVSAGSAPNPSHGTKC
jgi:hypothetical protein